MSSSTATIRELRTDFRAVKRKIERHGQITITDHGTPAYVIRPVEATPELSGPMPDYYARVTRRQPKALSREATRAFWEAERGER